MADGNILGGLLDNPWVQGGGALLGAGADIYGGVENYQRQQALNRIRDILSNPNKLAAYIAKLFQPMSAAQSAAVNRDLSANWAARTGGAPGGAQAKFASDALAGIESQRYQAAVQSALQSLTGASSAGQATPVYPLNNLGSIMNVLAKLRGQQPAKTPGIATMPGSDEQEYFQQPGSYPGYIQQLEKPLG